MQLSPPTPEQEAHLKTLEDKGYDPSVIVGGPDWAATQAITHLRYLRKCTNEAEQIEYLSAALRLAESTGAHRGCTELAERLQTGGPGQRDSVTPL